jgi:hypothetical protein
VQELCLADLPRGDSIGWHLLCDSQKMLRLCRAYPNPTKSNSGKRLFAQGQEKLDFASAGVAGSGGADAPQALILGCQVKPTVAQTKSIKPLPQSKSRNVAGFLARTPTVRDYADVGVFLTCRGVNFHRRKNAVN